MINTRIDSLTQPEPLLFLSSLSVLAWLFYKVFLRKISEKRHTGLKRRFLSLATFLAFSIALAQATQLLRPGVSPMAEGWGGTAQPYLGLLTVVIGAIAVTRLAQILLYLALFRANMSSGVPRLLVNLFTLVFATGLFGWLSSEIFEIKLGPLLATSAAFSLVLGLALQDTLGNLFAGVALQIDQIYRLGDWIEVQHEDQKWTGQIHEITWRATLLTGYMGELISIPNRTVAQSQVIRFSHPRESVRRSQPFRFSYGSPESEVRRVIHEALLGIPAVLAHPAPTILMLEAAESWILYKVFYSIQDAELQYRVGDRVISRVIEGTEAAGLRLARPALDVRVNQTLTQSD
jgi:small-conductance mechanosensitive channel